MQIVIDTMQCPCRTLSDECDISHNECYEDDICSSCPLIRNGGVKLPKGHGDLKDMECVKKQFNGKEGDDFTAFHFYDALDNVPTLVPAEKEGYI